MESMVDERAPIKAKSYVVSDSQKSRFKKKWKEVVEKDMLVRGLRRTNARDCCLWRLGYKN